MTLRFFGDSFQGPSKYGNNNTLISLFTGLGRGLACMAIDCLYSLNGGRLSLGKGKISVFNNNFNYTIFSLYRTLNYIFFSGVIGALESYLLVIFKANF